MDKIPGIDLKEVVDEVTLDVIEEKRNSIKGKIKLIFQTAQDRESEIEALEKQIAKKRQSQDKAMAKIEKLRKGEWSVLHDGQAEKTDKQSEKSD